MLFSRMESLNPSLSAPPRVLSYPSLSVTFIGSQKHRRHRPHASGKDVWMMSSYESDSDLQSMITDALVRFSLRTDVCGKPARDNKCVALASAATDTQLTFVELKISSNADGRVIGKKKEEVQEKTVGQTVGRMEKQLDRHLHLSLSSLQKKGLRISVRSPRPSQLTPKHLPRTPPVCLSIHPHLLAQAENMHRQLLLLHSPEVRPCTWPQTTSTSISTPQCR